jgi:hypothetical protein
LLRNCLPEHAIERKIEGLIDVKGRRGRRRKQLLDDLKDKVKYWKLQGKHCVALCGEEAVALL